MRQPRRPSSGTAQPPGRLLRLALLGSVCAILGPPSTASSQPPRHIVYGGDESFPPYEYVDANGRPTGFNVRLVSELAKEAGLTVEFRMRPWQEVLAALESDAVDLAMAAHLETRDERYDYLVQIWTLRQVVLFLPGRDRYPSTMSELGHETVALQERSAVHELLAALPEIERPLFTLVRNQGEALGAVVRGQATAVAGNSLSLHHFRAAGNVRPMVEVPVKSLSYHLVTRRERAEEFGWLRGALDDLYASGRFNELVETRLLVPTVASPWRGYVGYLAAGAAVALVVLFAVGGWNRVLRRRVRERTRELTMAQQDLEQRVQERTQALEQANRALEADNLERQMTERALRESERRLETAMRAARLHFWEFYVPGPRLDLSRELVTTLGYDYEAFVGDPERWRSLPHNDDLQRLKRAFLEHVSGRRSFVEEDCRLADAEGRLHWFAIDGRIVERDQSGSPTRISGTARNIDERKRLETQLVQAQRLEGLGRLAGGVAHDFNNLLTAILGHVELVQQRLPPDDPRQGELLEIAHAGRRASTLVRQLLAFARRQPVAPRVVNVNALIHSVERLLGRLLGEDVALEVRAEAPHAQVRVDPGQLEQVLMNLAVNARDAMPDGGRLTIETGACQATGDALMPSSLEPGPYVCIRVSDTGVGIPPEDLPHLFEPFFTTKEVGKGTGLGLATCYGIVTEAGGAISVQSERGRGTTFSVWLRAVSDPVAAPPVAASTATAPAIDRVEHETILVAEDEPQVREMLGGLLEGRGYRVLSAASGPEALLLARAHSGEIHLLVSDVVMPQMSGPELASALRLERPGLPVLFMSGYTDRETRGLPAEAPLLQKPFQLSQFLERVRSLLGSRSIA